MVKKAIILLAVFVVSGFFSSLAFCQYASLDAKVVHIKGPGNLPELGVALNKTACDRLIAYLDLEDPHEFAYALEAYDILRIKNNTPAIVLDINLFEGKAKVIVLHGLQHKFSGWIPIEWLQGNSDQPVFSKKYQFVPYDFSPQSPILESEWGYK